MPALDMSRSRRRCLQRLYEEVILVNPQISIKNLKKQQAKLQKDAEKYEKEKEETEQKVLQTKEKFKQIEEDAASVWIPAGI